MPVFQGLFTYINLVYPSQQPHEIDSRILLISPKIKVKHREINESNQGHTSKDKYKKRYKLNTGLNHLPTLPLVK